jgi:hypothetical protein
MFSYKLEKLVKHHRDHQTFKNDLERSEVFAILNKAYKREMIILLRELAELTELI